MSLEFTENHTHANGDHITEKKLILFKKINGEYYIMTRVPVEYRIRKEMSDLTGWYIIHKEFVRYIV